MQLDILLAKRYSVYNLNIHSERNYDAFINLPQ